MQQTRACNAHQRLESELPLAEPCDCRARVAEEVVTSPVGRRVSEMFEGLAAVDAGSFADQYEEVLTFDSGAHFAEAVLGREVATREEEEHEL
eukprot:6833504-Prymnesium_polylepis.1